MPTSILFNKDNHAVSWGYEAEAFDLAKDKTGMRLVRRVKLHLAAADARRNPHDLSPLPPGMSATDVIAAYLRLMKEYILSKAASPLQRDRLDCREIKWVLTVPAIWSDSAKDAMIRAAEMAGMVSGRHTPAADLASKHPLELSLEPEAALLACLHSTLSIN